MRVPRWAAAALLAAAVTCFCAADLLNPGYDGIAEPVSRLIHCRAGWLIPAAVWLAAAGTAAGFWVLRRSAGTRPSRGERRAEWFLGMAAVALAIAGCFPADPVGHGSFSASEVIHGGAGWIGVMGFPFAAFALRRRLAAWPLTVLALISTLLTGFIICIWWGLTRSYASFPVGAHHSPFGLVERTIMYLDFAWLAGAAWRMDGR